jgi:flagellar basal body P-ring protein FlgI
MRRTSPSRASGYGAAIACAALILTGAGGSNSKKKPAVPPKVEETIGDVATIFGTDTKVEGVGLVIGLDGTGSEPAPSWQQKKLQDEMTKSGIQHAEKLLRSQNISLVIVRAVVPAGISTKDRFDIEIELPQASATSSLANGFLMETRLAERVMTKEGDKDDKVIAIGGGPVMIGGATKPADVKVGRVLGGGRALAEAPYVIQIKESRRSGQTSQLIENVAKQRFHQVEAGFNKGMVIAKTDFALEMKVPKIYHHNQDRYHLIVNYLHLVDNPALREQRMQEWGRDLLDPKKAGVAALRLEGLGPVAIPTLKQGLASADETVKFFAAESLAYLNDGDSAATLAEVAKKRPEFRSFALKAMAAMDQAASLLKLRALMSEPEPELRYGAFNALRTLDPNDPFLGKVSVLDSAPEPEPDGDMAFQIPGQPRKKPRAPADDPFSMYVVDCDGPPMVHVTRSQRCELVVFGKGQKLLTPVVLGSGGPMLLNASDGDDRVQISKITTKTLDAPETRVTCGLELSEVVRQMANIGATYPDAVAVLMTGSTQKNLPGPLVFDALPAANRAYDMAQLAGAAPFKKDDALKKTGADQKKGSLLQRMFGRSTK